MSKPGAIFICVRPTISNDSASIFTISHQCPDNSEHDSSAFPKPSISPPTSFNRRSKASPIASHVTNKPLPVPSTKPVPPPQKRRSTRTFILSGLALLILLLGGFGVYYPITLHNAALIQQATMTAVAPITATARAQAVDVATYNTAVATNGVMFGFNAQRTFFNS